MEVTLLNFSKRLNSTKQPTTAQLAAGKKFSDVTLKEITNIDNPVLKLAGARENDYAYNYAYIHDWGRYYHIKTADLRHEDIYHASLELDDLATFKTQILSTSAFVRYSSSDYSPFLIDDRVAMLTDVDISTITAASIFSTTPHYILSVVGENGVNCIIPSDPNAIPATLYQQQVTDLVQALCIQWSDAQSCLLDLIETPIDVGADYTAQPAFVGKIDIGDRSCVNQYFNSMLEEQYESIAIPVTYSDFRLFKFVNAVLYLPFVGTVELDLSAFYPHPDSSGLVKIHTVANPMTGSIVYTLKNGVDEIVETYTASCGRKLPINASSPRDVIGAITHIMSAAGAIATGKSATAISQTITAIGDTLKFRGSTIGSFAGSYGEYAGTDFILAVEKHNSRIEPSNLTDYVGRPCGKVRSLNGLTGFVQTEGFSINLDVNSDVIKSINSKLDAGIYIE